MHHELVLVDQSQLRQRQRELHTSHEQSLARLPLELLNGLAQIPAHELRVPVDPLQGARYDVLLCRVDRLGEGFHPIRSRSRGRRWPPRCLHHFVRHPPKEKCIGLVEILDRVTMQVFVRGNCTMIAAPVQCDVNGIPKESHFAAPLVAQASIRVESMACAIIWFTSRAYKPQFQPDFFERKSREWRQTQKRNHTLTATFRERLMCSQIRTQVGKQLPDATV